MGSRPVAIPPGFVLEEKPNQAAPAIPPGFVLEGEAQPQGSALSRFASNAWEQVNPIEAVKGLAQAVRHPIDTAKAIGGAQMDLIEQGGEAIGMGDKEMAIRKLAYGAIPLLGPAIDKSVGQIQEGDVAGGLGGITGIAANIAGPKALGKVTKGPRAALASKIYASKLKPSTTIPVAKRAAMVETGLREAIPVSKGGLDKIAVLMEDLEGKIAARIEATGPNRTISPKKVASRLDETEATFANQVNPGADLKAIRSARKEFESRYGGQDMTAAEALKLKRGTDAQLKSRSYGELKTAETEAQKALVRGLRDELYEQFPELGDLSAREASLIQLKKELERAVARSDNWNLMGIQEPLTATAVGTITQSPKAGAAAGFLAGILKRPGISTRLAIALSKGAKTTVSDARARIGAYSRVLGQAADEASQDPADQATPQAP
jgi:hypothetical protein